MPDGTTERLATWQLLARVPAEADLPTLAEVDIVVVGAGPAGVAAATIAAERGHSVVLVEKYGFAGGAAVAGMSGTICGMYLASDRSTAPEQVVFGFTERFRAALAGRRGLTKPQRYGKTWTCAHDPLRWSETADQFLTDAGVRILMHTAAVGVLVDGAVHSGVVVESNAGRAFIRAARTIDASGDGAIAARAGYDYTLGDHGVLQNPTMFFRLGNVDVARFLDAYGSDTICPEWVSERIADRAAQGGDLPRTHIWVFTTPRPGELLVNATRITGAEGRMLNVLDPEDFTEAELRGRRQVRAYARFLVEELPGCERAFVVDTGTEVGIRQTRTITGVDRLTNDDVVEARKRPDGICRVPWPIELHVGARPRLHWILDDYYDVPYRALVPAEGENIIVAGRCLSAQHEALASARVTAQCFEYGHAAGVAASISLRSQASFRDLDAQLVRAAMRRNGSQL